MVFLFRSGPFREKVRLIIKATRQHARNLGTFALIYKACMLLLRTSSPSGKERTLDTFVSGLAGGYYVFGRGRAGSSSVNQQIVIYIFARVMLALAKLSMQESGKLPPGIKARVASNAWPVFAATSWATIMWLYRWHPEVVQPSLRSSMKYMYDSTFRER